MLDTTARLTGKARALTRQKLERWLRIQRGKLNKLCRHRWGNHFIPDSDDGRAMLKAKLRFGLKPDNALTDAPWIKPRELKALQREAWKTIWQATGALIHLTYAERQACKLWILAPVDVPLEEVKRRQEEKRRIADRNRQRRKRQQRRQQQQRVRTVPNREQTILAMLADADRVTEVREGASPYRCYGWVERAGILTWVIPMAALVREAKHCAAFSRLRPSSLRVLVHRTVKRLEKRGAVKLTKQPEWGRWGPVSVLCVSPGKPGAIADAPPLGKNDCNRVTPDCYTQNGAKTMTYQAKRTPKTASARNRGLADASFTTTLAPQAAPLA